MKLFLKFLSKTIIPYLIVVALNVIVMEDVIEFKNKDTLNSTIIGLFAAGIALTVIATLFSSIYRRSIIRLIPCFHRNSNSISEFIN